MLEFVQAERKAGAYDEARQEGSEVAACADRVGGDVRSELHDVVGCFSTMYAVK